MARKLSMTALLRNARVLVFGFACTVGTISGITGAASQMDHRIEDLSSQIFSHRASGKTVIVKIDEKTINELHHWPLPRSLYGQVIKDVANAGAMQVVIDVDFSTPAVDNGQDLMFAQALAQSKIPITLLAIKETYAEEYPTPLLKAHADVASSYAELDADNVDREKPLSTEVAGKPLRSLGAALAGVNAKPGSRIHADWSIDTDTIPTISFSDVLRNRFPSDFFVGKNVALGATARMLGDRWLIPWKGPVPGVYAQVIAAETLYEGVPHEIGFVPALLATSIMCALALAPRRPLVRFGLMLATIPAMTAAATLVQHPFHFYAICSPGLILLWAGSLGQFAMIIVAEFVRETTHDTLTGLPNLTAMERGVLDGQTVVAIRMRKNLQITALIGRGSYGTLLNKIHERFKLASGGSKIFQVDDHSFAWTANLTDVAIGNIAEGLHALFAPSTRLGEMMLDITIAIGVAPIGTNSIGDAVGFALIAADHAAEQGAFWERYTSDAEDALWRMTLLGELDRAIDTGDIWVAYQPKHDLARNLVIGAEALIRWTHPQRGPIRPDYFIPIAEEAGRIERLTLHVLKTAIADFSRLPGGPTVAVNISTKMLGRDSLPGPISKLLNDYSMPAERLTLEITESAVMTGQAGIDELNRLRDLGVRISIDDYGTGQSTMSYLKTLPATELKIDQSFVKLVLTDNKDQKMVRSTIGLAHELGMVVVAEGVETAEVLAALHGLGCDVIQGFYIGRPIAINDFVKSLRKNNEGTGSNPKLEAA